MINIEKNAFVVKKEEKVGKRSVLFINSESDQNVKYSGNNIKGVNVITLENINILDLLKYKNIILTEETVKKLEQRYK